MFQVIWDQKSMRYYVYDEAGNIVTYHYYVASFDENFQKKLENKYNNADIV